MWWWWQSWQIAGQTHAQQRPKYWLKQRDVYCILCKPHRKLGSHFDDLLSFKKVPVPFEKDCSGKACKTVLELPFRCRPTLPLAKIPRIYTITANTLVLIHNSKFICIWLKTLMRVYEMVQKRAVFRMVIHVLDCVQLERVNRITLGENKILTPMLMPSRCMAHILPWTTLTYTNSVNKTWTTSIYK